MNCTKTADKNVVLLGPTARKGSFWYLLYCTSVITSFKKWNKLYLPYITRFHVYLCLGVVLDYAKVMSKTRNRLAFWVTWCSLCLTAPCVIRIFIFFDGVRNSFSRDFLPVKNIWVTLLLFSINLEMCLCPEKGLLRYQNKRLVSEGWMKQHAKLTVDCLHPHSAKLITGGWLCVTDGVCLATWTKVITFVH